MPLEYTGGFISGTEQKKEKRPGFFTRSAQALQKRIDNSGEMIKRRMRDEAASNKINPAQTAFRDYSTIIGVGGQVAGAIGDVIGEAGIAVGRAVLDQNAEREVNDFVAGLAGSKVAQGATSAYQSFAEKNPYSEALVSGAVNIGGLVGTGGASKGATSAAQAGVKSAAKTGILKATATASRVASPMASQARKIGTEVVESAGSQLTALSPQTIKAVVEGRVSKEAMESLNRISIESKVSQGLNEAIDDLSGLGKEYSSLYGQQVTIPTGSSYRGVTISEPIVKALDDFGIKVGQEDGVMKVIRGTKSTPLAKQTIAKLEDFVSTYGKVGSLSTEEFLNVRKALDNIVDWNSNDANVADSIVKAMRANYDKLGKTQIKGLAEKDALFAEEATDLKNLKRQLLGPGGQMKDNASSVIANLTNKGNEKKLARIEKYVPGITEDVLVLKAIEDVASASGIKVGTYTRGVGTAAATIANPLAGVLFFVATHPSVVVPLLRAYGQAKRSVQPVIEQIIKKVTKGKPMTPSEKAVFSDAVLDAKLYQGNSLEDGGRRMTSSFGGSGDSDGITKGIRGRMEAQQPAPNAPKPYTETGALTTTLLKDLEGKTTVSKQYILDATNRPELKQVEKDLIRSILNGFEGKTVNVDEFTKRVKAELLPLSVESFDSPEDMGDFMEYKGTFQRYENITLPDDLRGEVQDYAERIYQSPVKVSAGKVHFAERPDSDYYFGHTRTEDMADGVTRRVIEVQSDLYQKGNLEKEGAQAREIVKEGGKSEDYETNAFIYEEAQKRLKDLGKLSQYNDPTAHFRMIREELKQASVDGKEKLLFPTGETAMKVEGLGDNIQFYDVSRMEETRASGLASDLQRQGEALNYATLKPDELGIGQEISQGAGEQWIITDVLEDGKFKAVPKDSGDYQVRDGEVKQAGYDENGDEFDDIVDESTKETFDISGKIDRNNPIYKFYDKDVQKYLKRIRPETKVVTDKQGVSWYEVPVRKEDKYLPVEAFGLIAAPALIPLVQGKKKKK